MRAVIFDNDNRPRYDDRVMSAEDFDLSVFVIDVYGMLCLRNGRCGLYGSSEDEAGTITHPAERSAGVVSFFKDNAIFREERIIILAPCGY